MDEIQAQVLDVLLRGGSVSVAAGQAEVSIHEVYGWLENDDEFAKQYRNVQRAWDQNVIAKLYQEAMQGNVSAMSLWVKERQPVDWKGRDEEATINWEGMDDGELREFVFRTTDKSENRGVAGIASSCLRDESPDVSKSVDTTGA